MQEKLRKTGIDVIGDVPWGSHFCQFYQSKADLLDILVPYFKAALENGEAGMWVTSAPLTVADAKRALKRAVPDLPKYLAEGRMEIVPYTDWYMKDGYFDLDRVVNGWVEKLDLALARGFEGLRVTGNTAWLERKDWDNFAEYESAINGVIGKYRLLVLCTYSLNNCTAIDVMDVIRNHEFALMRKEGKWELIENAVYKRAKQGLLESEQKFRSLYFTMSEGVCLHEIIYDESGKAVDYRILDVNPAYESITGLKREMVIGSKASELYGTGEPPYLDVYRGVAMAAVGILGWRSCLEGGKACSIPDFRGEAKRKAFADDQWSPFPEDAGPSQPPPSIRGFVEPAPKVIAHARRLWQQQGYQGK